MRGLKGLLGAGIGLFGVLVFCGGVSGIAQESREWIYSLNGAQGLLPAGVMSLMWFIMMSILALFFAVSFIDGMNKKKIILFLLLGLLHTASAISLFLMRLPVLSLFVNLGISCTYIYLFSGVQRSYPRFFIPNFLYFLWICYIFAINYLIVILN